MLIGSAPDASWQKIFEDYRKKNTDAVIKEAEKNYSLNPNDDTLRKLLITTAKNCFVTEQSIRDGQALYMKIPVNHAACQQSSTMFDSGNYQATWIPQHLNTLIAAGSDDHITPLTVFSNNKLYQRNNILLQEISGAGHYPWFENPDAVEQVFQEFVMKYFSR